MPIIDETIINFEVYEDAKEFIGTASVTMPDLTSIVQTISGSGIAGTIEAIVPGHFDPMTMSMSFRTMTAAALNLAEPRIHQIELRVAQQIEDSTNGAIRVQPVKHVMKVLPKKYGGGTLAPASPADASGEYAVRYWATYLDGQKITEIDPFNHICVINGKDYLADVRRALGK